MALSLPSAVFILLAAFAAVKPTPVAETVARIGGEPVEQREYENWLLQHRGPMLANEFARHVVIAAEAERQGKTVTDEAVEAELARPFQDRINEAFSGSRDAWLSEVQQLGRSEVGLFAERRVLTRTHLLLQALVDANRALPEGFVESEWERRYGTGGVKPRLRVMRFAVPDQRRSTTDQRLELTRVARERAEAVLAQLVSGGEDFAELARRLSDDDETRAEGGLTPEDFSTQEWPHTARDAIAAMSVGEVSEPLTAPGGIWLVRVEEIIRTPLETVREQLSRDLLAAPPSEREYLAYAQVLVDAARVERLPALFETANPTSPSWESEPLLKVGESAIRRGAYGQFLRHVQGEQMIGRFVLACEVERLATEAGFAVTPEQIEERVQDDIRLLLDFSHNGDREDWLMSLTDADRTEELYLHEARLRTRTTLLAEQLIVRDREVPPAAVRQAWIDRHGEDGLTIHARMLVLRATPPADLDPAISSDDYEKLIAELDEQNLLLAEELRGRYEDGEDFAALVKQYSADPDTRELGGKMRDRFIPHEWDTAVAEAVTATALGELTPPVRFGPTWTLFEITERTSVPFESVEQELLEELRTARPDEPELAGFRNVLTRDIPVEVLPAMIR